MSNQNSANGRAVVSRRVLCTGLASLLGGCAVKPKPLDSAALRAYADVSLSRVTAGQEPIGRSVDLYEAFARSLKYNLDHRVELMQTAVRVEELNLSRFDMLPNLVASSGYAGRNNYAASSSISVLSKRQSLEPSYSQEKNVVNGDVAFSWNILDFGLSYVRAKQSADQVLIAAEARRRVVNRIIEDTRTAYWRALTSERLSGRLKQLERRTEEAIRASRGLFADRQTSPVSALTSERELVEIKRDSQAIEGELKIARSQLAALINVAPIVPFKIAPTSNVATGLNLGIPEGELIRTALGRRPELREVQYKQRINEAEAQAQLIKLLPGINLVMGANADSNDLLYNQNWVSWGARASWNLMRLFQYPQIKRLAAAEDELLNQRALALTMAIMTQVYVSRARHAQAQKELATAAEYRRVQRQLLDQMRSSKAVDQVSEQSLIREEMNTVIAEVKYDLAFANVQNARANVYASLGLDTLPVLQIADCTVAELANNLRGTWVGQGSVAGESAPLELDVSWTLRRD